MRANAAERGRHIKVLAAMTILTIVIWHSPIAFILYPFTLLATWFHEMGHGIAAMLVGGRFEQLVILRDGSGFTRALTPADMSAWSAALVSAGGPLGPAIAGGALIVASRWRVATNGALVLLAGALLLSCLLVVRGITGWIVLPLSALAILLLVARASLPHRQLALQFLGLQACISTYTSLAYLFSRGGVMTGGANLSDTEQMARALFLPYWFWGGLLTLAIAAIVSGSLWLAYRR